MQLSRPDLESLAPHADRIVEIRTTFASREAASACATRLVGERLAACAQIDGPITSVYRWKGTLETAEEFRCTVKTSPERAAACVGTLLASHEYDTPELIVHEVWTSVAYAAWVRESVEPESRGA